LNAPANRATTPAIEFGGRDEEGISASDRDLVADLFHGQAVDPPMSREAASPMTSTLADVRYAAHFGRMSDIA
jgi:hypothetical protein